MFRELLEICAKPGKNGAILEVPDRTSLRPRKSRPISEKNGLFLLTVSFEQDTCPIDYS